MKPFLAITHQEHNEKFSCLNKRHEVLVKVDKLRKKKRGYRSDGEPEPIAPDEVIDRQNVEFGELTGWGANYDCDWDLQRMYVDINYEVYRCFTTNMGENTTFFLGCNI